MGDNFIGWLKSYLNLLKKLLFNIFCIYKICIKNVYMCINVIIKCKEIIYLFLYLNEMFIYIFIYYYFFCF